MFSIVAVPIDAYKVLPSPQHRWLLTCFSSYVDRAGKACPSLRQLVSDARMSLATVSRYMADMAELGVFQRERKPGGRYRYVLADAYRPRWPGRGNRGVPSSKPGVPQGAKQDVEPNKQAEKARGRARFAKLEVSFGELPDPSDRWKQRVLGWQRSRFWLGDWGPRPDEPGCWAPIAALQGLDRGG